MMELIGLAIKSGCPDLIAAFLSGADIHTETAIRAFGSADKRRDAKTLNFQVVYGGGEPDKRAAFFNAYPGTKVWIDKAIAEANDEGYVRTIEGRIRSLPELKSDNRKDREHGEREGVSTHVQGSTAEIVKKGMIRLHGHTRDSEVRLFLQVHDETVSICPDVILRDVVQTVNDDMTDKTYAVPFNVDISVGKSWGKTTEYMKKGKFVEEKPVQPTIIDAIPTNLLALSDEDVKEIDLLAEDDEDEDEQEEQE
jgi:DNA polymerase-1